MTGATEYLVSVPLLMAIFFTARLAPLWKTLFQGCDAYFFLLCAEDFRSRRRLPIRLPSLYLLEPETQSYPPLFAVLLGLLPKTWLERCYWALNSTLDAVICVGLFIWIDERNGVYYAWAAGLSYAFNGALTTEYRSLTSRPLAAILFIAVLVSTHLSVSGDKAAFAFAVISGFLLLYTHKLTIQLLWFLLPFLAITQTEAAWMGPWLVAYGLAIIAGRCLFLDMLRAHWDIIRFWNRNWPWLGAHQVRDSPLYGSGTDSGAYHRGLSPRVFANAKRLIGANPWMPLALLAFLEFPALDEAGRMLAMAVIGIYLWAAMTLMIPWLRCVGDGLKYVKYAEPLTLMLSAEVLARSGSSWIWGIACLCVALSIRQYLINAISVFNGQTWTATDSSELRAMAKRLEGMAGARVVCLPSHIADFIAYYARKPVLWGTHGYGFRNVEPFFPVIRRKLEDLCQQYGLTHLLLDRRYAELEELKLKGAQVVAVDGGYSLVSIAA